MNDLMNDPSRLRQIRRVGVVLLAAIVAGCANDGSIDVAGAGSCPLVVEFRGERYAGHPAAVEPPIGRSLGEAVLPSCDDTNAADPIGDERITVKRIRGIDPAVALVWDRGPPSSILITENVEEIPAELRRYFERPVCDPTAAPVTLFGTWHGILGPHGTTELDLVPPYSLEIAVLNSSDPAYEGAQLVVRVPAGAGPLVTRRDIRTSLWTGGSIDVRARCDGPRFLATSVRTYPG